MTTATPGSAAVLGEISAECAAMPRLFLANGCQAPPLWRFPSQGACSANAVVRTTAFGLYTDLETALALRHQQLLAQLHLIRFQVVELAQHLHAHVETLRDVEQRIAQLHPVHLWRGRV